jgi:homoserine acetyltransferase
VASFEDQADQMALLLDAIDVKEVAAVHGMSGGGPCCISFAARHNHRLHALLLECAVSGKFDIGAEATANIKKGSSKSMATSSSVARAS